MHIPTPIYRLPFSCESAYSISMQIGCRPHGIDVVCEKSTRIEGKRNYEDHENIIHSKQDCSLSHRPAGVFHVCFHSMVVSVSIATLKIQTWAAVPLHRNSASQQKPGSHEGVPVTPFFSGTPLLLNRSSMCISIFFKINRKYG